MKKYKRFIQNRVVKNVFLAGFVAITLSVLLVLAAIQGWPKQMFQFTGPYVEREIPADSNIAGWASFDKDSYQVGEVARYRIRVLWRHGVIQPDLETFRNSVAFFPFSRRDLIETERELAGGITEYTVDFILQAVDVDPSVSYSFPSPVIYYTFLQEGARELQAHRILAPSVHIGGFYPGDVSEIPLLALRDEIHDPVMMRQSLMFLLSGVTLFLAVLLVWHFGQRRHVNRLSEPEQLWRQYHKLDPSLDNRVYLIHCEQIFTRLLHHKTGISPMMFWSGRDPEDDLFWKDASAKVRELLSHGYLRSAPDNSDVNNIKVFLDEIFSSLVEEERLHREQEPAFTDRIKQQPYALASSGALLVITVILAIVATQPSVWFSSEISGYNQAVKLVNDELTMHRGYEELTELAESATDQRVKAAALYNAGTLATNPRLTDIDPEKDEALLKVMFQEQRIFLEALLHAIDIDDEFTLITMLTETVRSLTQGEAMLKSAVRISPDIDTQRNLELLGKRRKAYAESIRELLQQDEESGAGEMQRQSVIDLELMMQQEMPEEYSEMEQEGKDDKSYFIMEGF